MGCFEVWNGTSVGRIDRDAVEALENLAEKALLGPVYGLDLFGFVHVAVDADAAGGRRCHDVAVVP